MLKYRVYQNTSSIPGIQESWSCGIAKFVKMGLILLLLMKKGSNQNR